MKFNLAHLLLMVVWCAVAMAGFMMGGPVAAMMICLLLGLAMLCASLTIQSWPSLRAGERWTAIFAVLVSLIGVCLIFLSLVERQSG